MTETSSEPEDIKEPTAVATWSELPDREPTGARVADVDLVIVRDDDEVSVLYGRCQHRGVLLADGHIEGQNLICGVHGWDYRYDTGISEYDNSEQLEKFSAWIDEAEDAVYVDAAEIREWNEENPNEYDEYDVDDHGVDDHEPDADAHDAEESFPDFYGDPHPEKEPHTKYIQHLAQNGLDEWGHHGKVSAMGVPQTELPSWSDIQIQTAQLATIPARSTGALGKHNARNATAETIVQAIGGNRETANTGPESHVLPGSSCALPEGYRVSGGRWM
jgi:nitrite reductase/ring-hydroxylating ferredoxin subunit